MGQRARCCPGTRVCMGCAAVLGAASFLNRFQACFLFSVASYASLFMSLMRHTGLSGDAFDDSPSHERKLERMSRSVSRPAEDIFHLKVRKKQKYHEWCGFSREGDLCTTTSINCTRGSSKCSWFPPGSPVAVIFSDRLIKTGMVTMTSLCRHPTTLYVLVLMQVRTAALRTRGRRTRGRRTRGRRTLPPRWPAHTALTRSRRAARHAAAPHRRSPTPTSPSRRGSSRATPSR